MTKIIAEIGCNHKGDFEIAKRLIKIAKKCGANVAKFQKRNNKSLLTKKEYNQPHPEPWNSYGNTYGEHREALEFTTEQHEELKKVCDDHDIIYSSSVWDLTSATEISSIKAEMIKIPSATNLDFEMQKYLCNNFAGKIHLSIGMTSDKELTNILNFYKSEKRIDDLILYCCTSGYPIKFDEICLLEIRKLQDLLR